MITETDREPIRELFRKVSADLAPLLEQRRKQLGGKLPLEQTENIMRAQNTLRVCMEVVFNECLPYDDVFCGEMAVRLAAYAISAVPIERQPDLLKAVLQGLPVGLAEKLRQGAILHTVWEQGGVEHPNVPEKKDVQ